VVGPLSVKIKKNLVQSVCLYYAIAIGWSWLLWTPVVLGEDGLKLLRIHPSLPVFTCIATLGPTLGCLIVHRRETGNWRAVHLLPSAARRWLWILLGPLMILFCGFVLFPALISSGSPAQWRWQPSALLDFWFPMFNLNLFGGPLFEEPGWRGFLQPRLEQFVRPWVAALCVGVMWSVWHVPLFFVGWTSASPLSFLLVETGLAVLIAFAFNASGKAVLVAILMHAAFNASSQFFGPYFGDTLTRSTPPPETFIAFAYLSAAAIVILSTKGRLQSKECPAHEPQSVRQ
jgi:membrane protease YdiL (CAAX protease family)